MHLGNSTDRRLLRCACPLLPLDDQLPDAQPPDFELLDIEALDPAALYGERPDRQSADR
jgi:hypothetical protein